jgi:hypothetical protein
MEYVNAYFMNFRTALYGGIRPDVPGHGGEECAAYLPTNMKLLDTGIAVLLMIPYFTYAIKTYTLPTNIKKRENNVVQRILLVTLCVVMGIQIGFKISAKSLLYILNPCYLMTAVEIYLLSTTPSKFSVAMLRMLIHHVYGAAVAMLFPEVGPTDIFGRMTAYWVQHILIFFVVPPYLLYYWGIDCLEPTTEFAWAIFSGIYFGIHQLFILQPLAMVSHVNLNFILCPARLDPFKGPYYRLAAVFHQMLCLLFCGKVYSIILKLVIRKRKTD